MQKLDVFFYWIIYTFTHFIISHRGWMSNFPIYQLFVLLQKTFFLFFISSEGVFFLVLKEPAQTQESVSFFLCKKSQAKFQIPSSRYVFFGVLLPLTLFPCYLFLLYFLLQTHNDWDETTQVSAIFTKFLPIRVCSIHLKFMMKIVFNWID